MLRFAVGGCPLSTPAPGGTIKGLRRAAELGITAMEMEWVQMVPKGEERMREIRDVSEELGITLTVHAPYYVNLNTPEPEKMAASKKRVTDALKMAQLAGAWSVCVHAAFYLKATPEEAFERIAQATADILKHRARDFPDVNLAYETMGKPSQFGTMEEVLTLSKEFGIHPCIDPAHLHARSNGAINTTEEWNAMLDHCEKILGKTSLRKMHMHYSGIAYGEKGEKKHLALQESDARWKDFLMVLRKRDVGGTVVVESPILEDDTVLMRVTFAKLQ